MRRMTRKRRRKKRSLVCDIQEKSNNIFKFDFLLIPEEDDEDKVKPKHPLLVESELLLYQVKNNLNLLSARPVSIDKVTAAVR